MRYLRRHSLNYNEIRNASFISFGILLDSDRIDSSGPDLQGLFCDTFVKVIYATGTNTNR